MIRFALVGVFATFLSGYAWKDWFKATCGLVVMLAILERPDMPKSLFGVTGLNPWNITMLSILMAWKLSKEYKWKSARLPVKWQILIFWYVAIIIISVIRLLSDYSGTVGFSVATGSTVLPTTSAYVIDQFINSLKWMLPGLIFYYGYRDDKDLKWAIVAILITVVLFALQVIKWMPLSSLLTGDDLSQRALRVLDRQIGYHRIDLAAMLASGSWALVVARMFFKSRLTRLILLCFAATAVLGLALTGGRAGYLTWIILGLIFAWLRWRRLFFVMPIALLALIVFVPAAKERLVQGTSFEVVDESYNEQDLHQILSGRNLAWPTVLDRIGARPFFGYGRMGMQQSGASLEVLYESGRGAAFAHPHNAYLELLIDNGIIGALPILIFYVFIALHSKRLFQQNRSVALSVLGGFGICFVVGQMIAGLSAQSFYPRQGVVMMWCIIGLLLKSVTQSSQTAKKEHRSSGIAK